MSIPELSLCLLFYFGFNKFFIKFFLKFTMTNLRIHFKTIYKSCFYGGDFLSVKLSMAL